MIQFGVLGSLELRTTAGARTLKGPKARQVMSLLLLRANEVVDVDTLAEELWDLNRSRSGVGAIRTHVYNLRSALAADKVTRKAADMLVTESTGYMLRLEPGQLDATEFASRVEEGRDLFNTGRIGESARVLREALGMWRGRALANVSPGPVLSRHLTYLDELRNRAVELRLEADMLLGNHRELVAELRSLIAVSPLNEWYHIQLIDVLHRSGRRGEALMAFHNLRRLLDRELGLEPSADARRIQHEILTEGSTPYAPAN
ncbi:AfsR/SARP family transcriptional regulator [Spongiactinospora sp. TRM90649]|uniref:AfsR/SARP family transcriptional regulator n=1 Tax=Spongiactinospora sp. TRM90649 TaxID=3031114 RepID=UPI0023F753F4|nr:AfsR/SARP family transcriptional regulator [Spongiactinospora sp. TRM90649]MDF5752437.1 AfsR/SARP family transcriptional regulator [Spongiactinospora sp. TRM90649]